MIPLSEVGSGKIDVELISKLQLPNEVYEMEVRWIIADSVVGGSPINGELVAPADPVASPVKLTFGGGELNLPSVRIGENGENDYRLYGKQGVTFSKKLHWEDIPLGNEVSVALLKKNDKDGQFAGTGWTKEIVHSTAAGAEDISIALNNLPSGSYCLHATVMEGLIKVTETKYYFIIE